MELKAVVRRACTAKPNVVLSVEEQAVQTESFIEGLHLKGTPPQFRCQLHQILVLWKPCDSGLASFSMCSLGEC